MYILAKSKLGGRGSRSGENFEEMHILGDVTSENVELQIAGGQADDERGEEGEDGIAPELNPKARRHAVLGRHNSHHGRRRRQRKQ